VTGILFTPISSDIFFLPFESSPATFKFLSTYENKESYYCYYYYYY
jgi:hypothetical protein